MFGVGALDLPDLPRLEIESRNSPGIGIRGSGQPEIRDASEPLDALKLELEALKLVPALVGKRHDVESRHDVVADQPWERVKSVRDVLAAEIEVRKRQKRRSWTPRKITPPVQIEESRQPVQDTRDVPPRSDSDQSIHNTNSGSGRGTEDYPIPVTRSLEQTTKEERKSQAIMERRAAVPKLHTAKKPPLAPRPKSSSPAPLSMLPPPPPPLPPPQLQAKKAMLKIASPNLTSKKPALTNADVSTSEPRRAVEQKYTAPKPVQSIVIEPIEPVDPVPGAYNVPIFVDDDDFEEHDVIDAGSAFHGSSNALHTIGISDQQAPPFQISSLIKSAYSLIERDSDPAWPEELAVPTKKDMLSRMPSTGGNVGLIDLSQIDDADELEAEYARLVNEKGIVSDETQQETRDGDSNANTAQSQVSQGTITIIPSSDDTRFSGMRPLDELRKKSMMEVSSGEQDLLSTDDIKMAVSSQPKGGEVDMSAGVITEKKPGVNPEDKPAVMKAVRGTREAPPETMHPSNSMGQEPAESVKHHYSRSRSDEFSSSSGSMDGSHSFTSIEEDDPSSPIECQQYAFVATKKRKIDKAARRRNRSEYGYIESVVAEYFGARRNILCESADHANGEYKRNVFTDTSRGCCMAFH